MHEVVVKAPAGCTPQEIGDFAAFVMMGGEVIVQGLEGRVRSAECLSFLRESSGLAGVAGLKHPSQNHRREVAECTGVSLPAASFPFEIGWVFILPDARGLGLSLPLCQPLVEAAGSKGIFATSRTDNHGMHKTLQKLGFAFAGAPYKSPHGVHGLQLFLRQPAKQITAGERETQSPRRSR